MANTIPIGGDLRYLEPEITEERVWNYQNLGIVIFLGIILAIGGILIITFIELTLAYKIVVAWALTIIYAAVLFFALEPRVLRQIKATAVRTIIKPIEKKVFVEKPVPVEKKVFIEKPIEKKVFVEKPKLPKYDYVASTKARTYHKAGCKFAGLIKPKYKRVSNDPYDFHSKGYKRCKTCFGLGKSPRRRRTKIIERVIVKEKASKKKTKKKK